MTFKRRSSFWPNPFTIAKAGCCCLCATEMRVLLGAAVRLAEQFEGHPKTVSVWVFYWQTHLFEPRHGRSLFEVLFSEFSSFCFSSWQNHTHYLIHSSKFTRSGSVVCLLDFHGSWLLLLSRYRAFPRLHAWVSTAYSISLLELYILSAGWGHVTTSIKIRSGNLMGTVMEKSFWHLL